jgi:hypothetical protein
LYELCAAHQKVCPTLGSKIDSKMDNERCHSSQYQEDAHQIIGDFRKNHYDDTADKGADSSNET